MSTEVVAAIVGAVTGSAITQLLNVWKLSGRIGVIETRLNAIEKKVDQIGKFQLNPRGAV